MGHRDVNGRQTRIEAGAHEGLDRQAPGQPFHLTLESLEALDGFQLPGRQPIPDPGESRKVPRRSAQVFASQIAEPVSHQGFDVHPAEANVRDDG